MVSLLRRIWLMTIWVGGSCGRKCFGGKAADTGRLDWSIGELGAYGASSLAWVGRKVKDGEHGRAVYDKRSPLYLESGRFDDWEFDSDDVYIYMRTR